MWAAPPKDAAKSKEKSKPEGCVPVRLDAGGLDDRPPPFNFGGLEGGKGRRGLVIARWSLLAQVGQPTLDAVLGERIDYSGVELGDDLLRGTRWRPHAEPDRDVETGNPASSTVGMTGAEARRTFAVTA
jgi:hypothetical protein